MPCSHGRGVCTPRPDWVVGQIHLVPPGGNWLEIAALFAFNGKHGVGESVARMRRELDCGQAGVFSGVAKTLRELFASGLIEIHPIPSADV